MSSPDYSQGYNDAVKNARDAIDHIIENMVANDSYGQEAKEALCEAQMLLKNEIREEDEEEIPPDFCGAPDCPDCC